MYALLLEAAAGLRHALDGVEKRLDWLEQSILSARRGAAPR
jgi:hypothetical protein